jgi:hypothetical protein
MSKDQINTSNFTQDDISNFTFHKANATSRENSRFGPSMNFDYFVPNKYGGGVQTIPSHLYKYKPPGNDAPSESSLVSAKLFASECPTITFNCGPSWLGIDYTDPNATYNCFCNAGWPKTESWVPVEQNVEENKPNPSETLYGYRATSKDQPRDLFPNLPPYVAPSYPDCGEHFPKYVEYSKTQATFWNTPPKTPLFRRAQTALLTYHRIKILVYGNFNVKPGKLVKIDYPIGSNENIKKSRYDGLWMVYKVKHVLSPINHTMFVYLMRDGSTSVPATTVTMEKRSY